ncbi:hypothetical protein LAZ40_09420 [Cereibacter sphaeroides]|uniref:hypothetical protein n=1 Tax=Cereibacter sphaeroides TaxID=1063 RepID=UPI001F1B356B|nr:hypothetical protein [Cereibacter sphaeroides]MCE6959271.1 hypothetical protein [Cereibacter sphaeroides]MCE6972863.1 hypothetical protein [Cereibacter sphaeroides]
MRFEVKNPQFPGVPETGNLRAFLEARIDEEGDGMAELLSHARTVLEKNQAGLAPEILAERIEALEEAEAEFNEEGREDRVRAPLQAAFEGWMPRGDAPSP